MKLYFPYDSPREEQRKLMEDFVEAIASKKVLLAHAPTGLGKTISSLAPALSFALENKKIVFFVTPKISQHEIVLESVNLMNEKFNLGIKAIDLVGRKNLCLDPMLKNLNQGFYEACSKKKKTKKCVFYNNCKGSTPKSKKQAAIRKSHVIHNFNCSFSQIKDLCAQRELCPYEVTLEMCRNANLIIGDYSHVFDKGIRENIFSQAGIDLKDVILVVDEAHNLPKRIRDMMSLKLDREVIEKAIKECSVVGDVEAGLLVKDLLKEFDVVVRNNLSITKAQNELKLKDLVFFGRVGGEEVELLLDTSSKFMEFTSAEGSALLSLATFVTILREGNLIEDESLVVVEKTLWGPRISINGLNPSVYSGEVFDKCFSGILMSGTLVPLEMYVDVLGIKNFVLKEYLSPFPRENRLNLFVNKTTTRYSDRSEKQFDEIADEVNKIVSLVPGNIIVFFPSFEILREVEPRISQGRKVFVQEQSMAQEQKSNLVKDFKLESNGFGGILLAVSGGSIAEGVDFPGAHLSCAIIVGIPFARVGLFSNALIKYYDIRFKKGWDYGYNAPAISKAVQAAGRVIRTESDKGICVFLDKRFVSPMYSKYFPKNFDRVITSDSLKEIKDFLEKD